MFYVGSEINPLEKVLVHIPDAGISRINPKRSGELLFDDIVDLNKMQEEHRVFTDVIASFIGEENVLEANRLIPEALDASDDGREEIIDLIAAFEELPKIFTDELKQLPTEELAEALITGYMKRFDTILFDPVPNFVFTRDIAVFVRDHVIITKAAREARHRENLLSRFIFWRHPIFSELKAGNRLINLNIVDEFPPGRGGERVSIEGGDMMILNDDYLLVGCSERSTEYAFHSLKDYLFDKGIVKHMALVKIPPERSFMHIDTLFTRLHHQHMLAFKPVVVDGMSSLVDVYSDTGDVRTYSTIKQFVLEEIQSDMEFILCGNGVSPYQEREQWTDACNLLAIRPGVVVAYDRNKHTEAALKASGYSIIHALDYLRMVSDDAAIPANLKHTVITIPSSELSRARGGSHCMSCPISRTR